MSKVIAVSNQKGGTGKTTNVKNVRMEQLVFQSEIKTQEQIKELNEKGYHDCRRKHDGESKQHGYDSAEYYKSSVNHPDEITAFLIQYHSIDDKYGYKEIELNPALSEKADIVSSKRCQESITQ